MTRLSLFRRRHVWLPSLAGWVLLLAISGMAGLAGVRIAYPFLAQNSPAQNASLLIIEGWMDAREFDQAIAAFRRGKYQRVVTTGGPIASWPELLGATNHADFAANYVRRHGLADVSVSPVPAPASAQERTYLSAVKLREWAASSGLRLTAVDVVSSGTHTRRTGILYRMALGPETDVGVLAARPSAYDPDNWWKSSAGAKAVLGELIGLVWTRCCFFPAVPGSHEELWGAPAKAAVR